MVDQQLDALSVETRREIYRLLVARPRSVGELADALPVSRPAVSQHLRVLVDARLAIVEPVGTRHVYSADPEGMRRLRDWVDGMWEMALGSFARFASEQMEDEMEDVRTKIEPVRKEILVPGTTEQVFELFTTRIDEWWPTVSHSVSGEEEARVVVEGGQGGRIYEVTSAGEEHDWATFTDWVEGDRLEMVWYPGLSPEQSTRLTIVFEAEAGATRVTLVHDGWEARGIDGVAIRANYDSGWDQVLGRIPEMSPA